MKITERYYRITGKLENLENIVLLAIRLILAYGFFVTAKLKVGNVEGIASWFASMHYPLPLLNAYLATITEVAGVILLALGLGTRIISIPLMIVMVVAITTVHWGNGFNAGNNGFEIPVYYLLFLFVLLVKGAGKLSIDYLIDTKAAHSN